MRSTCRLLLAAVLFVMAAGIATAQDPNPPPAPDPVATPAPVLPPLPVDPNAVPPVVDPSVPSDPNAPPAVAPPPVIEPLPDATISAPAETKKVKKSTSVKKASPKPVEPAPKPETETDEAAKAAAAVAAIEPPSSTPPTGGTTAPEIIAPAPAAPPAVAAPAETGVELTKKEERTNLTTWILGSVGLVGGIGVVVFFLRRRKNDSARLSIYDRGSVRTRPI